ncbi:sensor histidine kinase KdpD [Klenkia sp. PcliD-1-E]|uniref:sensor histidine kinase n=1 Tax=Klenkia sp. PcliD-1-E TaxID=2954492 RepID=UPI00209792C3|nr:HAMP domain-containing sensor histidine kinase [Klenkia sp. PcliD-1-E]MCO7220899.1 HAMP domain-containing histidine kinase [Klenkia sp. PcliD-1-E]
MRRTLLWVAALLPLAAGVVLAVLGRSGRLPGQRLYLSALPGDWALAAGAALSLVAVVGVGTAALRDRAWGRRLAARTAETGQDRRLLLSRLDHELKNPLTAMRAATANLAAIADPAQDAAVGTIEEQVLRLSRLTTDLRKIADIESARIDRRPVDLTDLIEEMVDVARDLPGAAEREIAVDLPRAPWPLPPVPGDADLLSLAVANLLDNALKYTPPGGRVEVRAREAGGEVVVEVADTGQGIPPEELPQVWEEMYRSPSARAVPGSGLGLPLVRAVVERHGGHVHADSRVGSGTLVRLTLPC